MCFNGLGLLQQLLACTEYAEIKTIFMTPIEVVSTLGV